MRQRGTRFHPGQNTGLVRTHPRRPPPARARHLFVATSLSHDLRRTPQGKDHTIYSLAEGHVRFKRDNLRDRTFIYVEPPAVAQRVTA